MRSRMMHTYRNGSSFTLQGKGAAVHLTVLFSSIVRALVFEKRKQKKNGGGVRGRDERD